MKIYGVIGCDKNVQNSGGDGIVTHLNDVEQASHAACDRNRAIHENTK